MKNVILLLALFLIFTGCSKERECLEQAQKVYDTTFSRTIQDGQLLLTEDTVLEEDENFLTVRLNGWNLECQSLNVTNFIMLNKGNNSNGGSITAHDDVVVGSNVFFFEDEGVITTDTGISVGGDITGKGTIYYCTFFINQNIDEDVEVIENCTLSDGDSIKYGEINYLPCGFDYANQPLKKDDIGFYKYRPLN